MVFNNKLILEWFADISGAYDKTYTLPISLNTNVFAGLTLRGTKTTTPIVNNMLKSIKSKLSYFASAGRAITIKFADGINQTKSSVAMAFTSAIAFAVTSIRSNYLTFYTAGSYLGSGLVLGINSKQTSVYNAGYKLGRLAAQGEKDGQASNSPSKLTILPSMNSSMM